VASIGVEKARQGHTEFEVKRKFAVGMGKPGIVVGLEVSRYRSRMLKRSAEQALMAPSDDRVQKESENGAHARMVSNGRSSRIQDPLQKRLPHVRLSPAPAYRQ
jgi:hypothetical protein